MTQVIRIVCMADGRPSAFDGMYLWSWDLESGFEAALTAVPDPRSAHQFSTPAEALALWRSQSARIPKRPDGKPNRPLTAYTIEILSVDVALAEP